LWMKGQTPPRENGLAFVHATRDSVDADDSDRARFGDILGASIPEDWPPPMVEHPDASNRWQSLYFLVQEEDGAERVLGGMAGVSWLNQNAILLGFNMVENWQKRGIGTKAFALLTRWASSLPDVSRVVCDIPEDRKSAAKTLLRVGYKKTDVVPYFGFIRYEYSA
jgi:[ribosomal protein S5]-alanine N-acetyltransferase